MPESRDDIIGRLAVEQGAVTDEQLTEARDVQRKAAALGLPETLEHVMVAKGMLSAEVADELLAAATVKTGEGRIIGNYEILEKLGQGGMGSVYKARHLQSGYFVALKILPPSMADETMVARFKREASIAARLDHPNIVKYVEFGFDRERGMYYCALEYVDGDDVGAVLKKRNVIEERDAVTWAYQIADALQHAYKNGLVHRDIKPENIIVMRDATAKLLDLGLARHTVETEAHLTQEGHFVGSPMYTSPEQAQGKTDVDIRADIYSLGVTLYTMVTGGPPFYDENSMKVLQMHLSQRAPWPTDINPDLSDGLCRVIAKMMCKQADDRYQMPKDVLDDLEMLARGETPEVSDAEIAASSVASPMGRKVEHRPMRPRGTTKATRVGSRPKGKSGSGRTGTRLRPVKSPQAGAGGANRTVAVSGVFGGIVALALLLMLAGGGEEEGEPRAAPPRVKPSAPRVARTGASDRPTPAVPPPTRADDEPSSRTPAGALKAARQYESDHPADLRGALARFEAVARDFDGTTEAALAQIDIARVNSRLNPPPARAFSAGRAAEVIRNGGFERLDADGTPVGWVKSWRTHNVQWRSDGIGRWVRLGVNGAVAQRIDIEPEWTALVISARVRGESIVRGAKDYSLPRVNVEFYNAGDERIGFGNGPDLKQDSDWRRIESRTSIVDGAVVVNISPCNMAGAGHAEFDDISVRPIISSGSRRSSPRRREATWSVDFEKGLPASWSEGVHVSAKLPPGSRGGVASAGKSIASNTNHTPGHFIADRSNVLHYTFRVEKRSWHYVLLACRDPRDHTHYENVFHQGPHFDGLGKWATASLPLGEFAMSDGTRVPADWIVTKIMWGGPRGDGDDITIDRVWVTSGGADEKILNNRAGYYKIIETAMPWDDARRWCELRGGQLVCINDEPENAFVKGMVREAGTMSWLGLTRRGDDWHWLSGEKVTFTDWAPGEPNDQSGEERSAHMSTYAKHDLRWNDVSGDNSIAFVCEWRQRPDLRGRSAPKAVARRDVPARPVVAAGRRRGPIGWWKLDETSGRVAHDSSGNGNHGTVNGNPVWRPGAGRIGGALALDPGDGTKDYVELPKSASLSSVPPRSLTVAAWYRVEEHAPDPQGDNMGRYSIVVRQGRHCGVFVGLKGYVMGEFWTGTKLPVLPSAGTAGDTGVYHHVCLVLDMREGTAVIYTDGQFGGRKTFDVAAGSHDYSTSPWRIGCSAPKFPRYDWPMKGMVDDVRLYDRALPADEVRALSRQR